ncbi:hypothetical protein ACGYK1_18170 [Sulfitobacter sp. 1A13191]|uniref:hypothetical protein n=1 Tax=Sulfitobacter sp. 1A13191 TaxID=3368589 RepID=UPI003745FDCF
MAVEACKMGTEAFPHNGKQAAFLKHRGLTCKQSSTPLRDGHYFPLQAGTWTDGHWLAKLSAFATF